MSMWITSPPNPPKTKRGANGKFLPKSRIFSCRKIPRPRLLHLRPVRPCESAPHFLTPLFHLRHPTSKTNQPKFWQILSSPKNSFAKTESALKPRRLPEYLYGQNPEGKTPFPFSKEISPPPNPKCKEFFSLGSSISFSTKLEPPLGLEPRTFTLQKCCSTN